MLVMVSERTAENHVQGYLDSEGENGVLSASPLGLESTFPRPGRRSVPPRTVGVAEFLVAELNNQDR